MDNAVGNLTAGTGFNGSATSMKPEDVMARATAINDKYRKDNPTFAAANPHPDDPRNKVAHIQVSTHILKRAAAVPSVAAVSSTKPPVGPVILNPKFLRALPKQAPAKPPAKPAKDPEPKPVPGAVKKAAWY